MCGGDPTSVPCPHPPPLSEGPGSPHPQAGPQALPGKPPPPKSALSKAWRSVLDPETTPLTTDTGRWSRLGSRKAPKVSLHRPHSI